MLCDFTLVKSFLPYLETKCCATIWMVFSPEIRITAMAPFPEGVANAIIGSLFSVVLMILN